LEITTQGTGTPTGRHYKRLIAIVFLFHLPVMKLYIQTSYKSPEAMKLNLLIILTCLTFSLFAQPENANRKRNFNTANYVALREFDPVSYFQGKPAKGTQQFEYHHKGIFYYFASDANREEFKKAPGKYEPAYGGWCAYTLANTGERVKIIPTAYKIVDGKLLLFYNFNSDNRLMKWNAGDEKKLKAAADKNWQKSMH
jgi:YHS domain-containing protein